MDYDKCINAARKSKFKQRHGAVIVYKGNIVSEGFNFSHSIATVSDGMHAEILALSRCKARYRKNATVYVCRINNQDELMLSYPCYRCRKIMYKMGIKYVWYSTGNGDDWERITLSKQLIENKRPSHLQPGMKECY